MFAPTALLFDMSAWGAQEAHTVPHVPAASAEGHAGAQFDAQVQDSGNARQGQRK